MRKILTIILIAIAAVGLMIRLNSPKTGFSVGTPAARPLPSPSEAGWKVLCYEDFEAPSFLRKPSWRKDQPDSAGRFSDNGDFFRSRDASFSPPDGYRISAPFGMNGFLTLECYSRSRKPLAQLIRVVADPVSPGNKVLQLSSPEHTDGNILRVTEPLGTRYKICARIGFMRFGTGNGLNDYEGDEEAEPWLNADVTDENGFYFGAIFRTVPQPHNNLWSHHERILFVDSDNNKEKWTSIWNPATKSFQPNGWHPIVVGLVENREIVDEDESPRFLTYSAGSWQDRNSIRAVDAYKDNAWYTLCFTRFDQRFRMTLSGDFAYGGQNTYDIPISDARPIPDFNGLQYWMMGDPHINYYEGTLLVDDISLSVWSEDP